MTTVVGFWLVSKVSDLDTQRLKNPTVLTLSHASPLLLTPRQSFMFFVGIFIATA
jgi:hypothetical protein